MTHLNLLTKSQIKVLEVLVNLDHGGFVSDIAIAAGLKKWSVHRTLKKFDASGFATLEVVERQTNIYGHWYEATPQGRDLYYTVMSVEDRKRW